MLGDALPAGVPAEAAEAARSTLGGAIAAAAELPRSLGSELTHAAESAFLEGVRLCAWVSTFGAIALAVFAWFAFRGARAQAIE
jgi:DHA2 family multidrug resistance protein-like MFS transporter